MRRKPKKTPQKPIKYGEIPPGTPGELIDLDAGLDDVDRAIAECLAAMDAAGIVAEPKPLDGERIDALTSAMLTGDGNTLASAMLASASGDSDVSLDEGDLDDAFGSAFAYQRRRKRRPKKQMMLRQLPGPLRKIYGDAGRPLAEKMLTESRQIVL